MMKKLKSMFNWWMKEYIKCAELEVRMNQIRLM
jgi:hypothetical protein